MVLVSHPSKFIYLKTRKTGGTTVEMYFERFCVPEGDFAGTESVRETVTATGIVGSRRGGKRPGDTWQNHMPAADVRRLLGAETWDRYFRFASIRNPYAAVVSQFFWKTASDYPQDDAAFDRARRAFERFVTGSWMRRRRWGNNLDVVGIGGVPQTHRLVRLEHLAEDVEAVCRHLGLPWRPDWLVHAKKTAGAPPTYPLGEFYTEETAALVRREFDWVFSTYDYRLAA